MMRKTSCQVSNARDRWHLGSIAVIPNDTTVSTLNFTDSGHREIVRCDVISVIGMILCITWWRNQMETLSALLAICAGNSSVPGEFPAQKPVTRIFDVFLDLHLNKPLRIQSWNWWFETLSHPLWRHCNDLCDHKSHQQHLLGDIRMSVYSNWYWYLHV